MDKHKKIQRDSSRTTGFVETQKDYDFFCMKATLLIFKLLGLAPWIIVRRSSGGKLLNNDIPQTLTTIQFAYSGLGCVYLFILMILITGINYITINEVYEQDYPFKTELTVTIEMIQAVCSNLIVIAIRILLCVKQNTVVKLFNRFMNIDNTIACLANERRAESNRLYFALLFLINTLVWIMVGVSEMKCYGTRPILSFFNDIFPIMIINWFMMQYVVMVKLIEIRFRLLNRALLDSSRSSVIQPIQSLILGGVSISAFYSPKIVTFRRTHTILYEIACDVSEFYSLPILLTIALASYSIIYNAYYLIMPFVMQLEVDTVCVIVNSMFWLTGLMLPIVMLATAVNRTTSEMRKTADAVHKLLTRCTTSREDKSELQQFSLELLQRNVYFTAYGLFPLDCTLVHSIFSMVVTYLIILFQFQLAGDRKSSQVIDNSTTIK